MIYLCMDTEKKRNGIKIPPSSVRTSRSSQIVPNTFTMCGDVVDENEIFLHGPWSFSHLTVLLLQVL